jgi:glutamate synthase (NADPH/NADH) small chain
MQRGQSLIVWAIAEGRSAAHAVDTYLMGRSSLPAPVQ